LFFSRVIVETASAMEGDADADVGLVLMIGADDLDLLAFDRAAEILRGHLRGGERAFAGAVGIDARHVGHDADLHDIVGDLRVGGRSEGRAADECSHADSNKSGDATLH
jgi:hypothetical protein